ncbi:MAG: glyoxalase [Pseudomonadales bacterium]|nr:glyoxalase [Pseudomonadales bacterium]
MEIKQIDHVQLAMPVGGSDEAKKYYSDVLGIPEVPRPTSMKSIGHWFHAGDLKVHLGEEEDFRPALKAHPAFEVDDLEALKSRLDAAGYSYKAGSVIEGIVRIFASDPFGNRIEFLQLID